MIMTVDWQNIGLWVLLALSLTHAAPTEDLIGTLPLVGTPTTPHYSGYLDATGACDPK